MPEPDAGRATSTSPRTGFTFGVLLSAWGTSHRRRPGPPARTRPVRARGGRRGVRVRARRHPDRFAAPAPTGEPDSAVEPSCGGPRSWPASASSPESRGGCRRPLARAARTRRGRGPHRRLGGRRPRPASWTSTSRYSTPTAAAYVKSDIRCPEWTQPAGSTGHSGRPTPRHNVALPGVLGRPVRLALFWLSGTPSGPYCRGWGFAPRLATVGLAPFWDPARLAANDTAAFTDPTPEGLRELATRYGVRTSSSTAPSRPNRPPRGRWPPAATTTAAWPSTSCPTLTSILD